MLAFNVVDQSAHRIVSVYGDIDMANAGAFELACRDADENRPVVVDLLACPYVDSTGLTALVKANKEKTLTVVLDPHSRIYRIFAITDLLNYFTVAATIEKALAPGVLAPSK